MSAMNCPHCGVLANFPAVHEVNRGLLPFGIPGNGTYGMALRRCENDKCRHYIIAMSRDGDIVQVWPEYVGGKIFPDVPTHVAEAANEAHRCMSIKAYRAAALLARSVIEAVAKEKGITEGGLVAKIDKMHSEGHIREYVKDGAHEVRYLGNEMAHGDFVDPVEFAEAELALALMDEVLDEVYQAPARVAAARSARLAKKQTTATPSQSSNA